ncbi:solute carrier family 25 (mitochondrial dicarboxylate transporter) member 10 [Andalucia godoyi]|uniref:Solute carrier family 25 (Mitochondrial dicarboxylate transporter) member 10 n=1 Tax=Andalucia godoyi TaxID=505711 RepID=A0A8K0AHX3_ANDGO|nr:solute carrier family 25 (mitochondrial dicarboxylate transporter) member 10 [Andalucia godoyi]|eukprot:ANDGO_05460.mRNA.1 solute carrier family 25 (mitochondrial uncoupling protein putative Asp Glu and dicarboxylate transporter) member 8/9
MSSNSTAGTNESVVLKFAAGGLSCALCSALLNPADLVKVRMVTTNELATTATLQHGHRPTLSFSSAIREIVRSEGVLTLWTRGLAASCLREIIYSSIRMGAYDPIKHMLANIPFFATSRASSSSSSSSSSPKSNTTTTPSLLNSNSSTTNNANSNHATLGGKIAAGLLSGAIGSAVANPTDIVKIRMQAERPNAPLPYSGSTFGGFLYVYRHEGGFRGLYRGLGPTVVRAAILTSAQLASYDHIKHAILDHGWMQEGFQLHLSCAVLAALITTTATNPADVVKTRYMNRTVAYSSALDCLLKTVRFDGSRALFRGWLPNFARLGPHSMISLPLLEVFRRLFGLSAV